MNRLGRDRGRGSSCAWQVVLAVLGVLGAGGGCGGRSLKPIRYGSLVVEERTFNYSHGVESFTLPNGLVVALMPDAHANLVSVDVRYRVGASDDPAGKTGLAHLVEHLLFETRAEQGGPGGPTLGNLLALASLSYNAETTWDTTHYREVALADKLDDLLAIEATRMTTACAGIDQASLDHERAVVAQELAEHGGDSLADAVLGDLYGATHRYASGTGGVDLAQIQLDDVCRFLDTHYAPDHAILVISGRYGVEATKRALATRFASIPRRATATRAPVRPPVLSGGASTHQADVEEATVLLVFPAAPWGSPAAFEEALVDQLMVRALRKLDHDERWITGVDSGRLGGMRDGVRYFAVSVTDPARLDDATAKMLGATSGLLGDDSGFALSAMAARRRTELFSEFESISDRGGLCADYLQFTYHKSFHLAELAALQDISTDRLRQRAGQMIRRTGHVVKVLPRPTATAHAARAALGAAAIDLPVWQASVDRADADRPLALPEQPRPPAVTELRLPNGLRVLMASGFSQPVFEARLIFPAGEFNSGSNQIGVANAAAVMLEHSSGKATWKDVPILEWAGRLGAQLSGEADDHTTFTVRGSSTFSDWHLWRLHWLLENGAYTKEDLVRAREDTARRIAGKHAGRAWRRALSESLFGRDHPYARTASSADVDRVFDVDDLESFREERYRANGAVLIIVGQFEVPAMTKTVTELFGAWTNDAPPPLVPVPAMHPATGPTWIADVDPDASQVRIGVGFAATSPRDRSRGARAVVAEMVRNRLAQVRTRMGASYGVRASYMTTEAGDAITADGHVDADRAGDALRLMLRALDGLRIGDDELTADFVRARRTALARALGDPQISGTVADQLEATASRGQPIDAATQLPAAIAATTLRDVRAVIAADLVPAHMVVLLGGRQADSKAAFTAAGVTRFQTVSDDPPSP